MSVAEKRSMRIAALAAALALSSGPLAAAGKPQESKGLAYVETAGGLRSADIRDLIRWTHTRLVFDREIDRLAVGSEQVMQVELLSTREALVLAQSVGRTSLMVWYADGTNNSFIFNVIEDLTVLKQALREIHPSIRVELAPDRAALILRGRAPTVKFKIAAENAARAYMGAGAETATPVLMQGGRPGQDADFRVSDNALDIEPRSAILNLIKVEELPLSSEEKIQQAIRGIGGEKVTVRRIVHGDLDNDDSDTLLLEGEVRDQITLVRVLSVASRLFLGSENMLDQEIEVLANESGGLLSNVQGRNNQLFGGSYGGRGDSLHNRIQSNIGRSKLLSIADGRILSMIDVADLPQVRIAVQMHEINRTRFKNWEPSATLVTDAFQGKTAEPSGAVSLIGSSAIEGALEVLSGTLTSQIQVGATDFAFDLLFSLMEKEGISHTLSRPTLTVLAGEPAVFQVGGEIPVPVAFTPSGAQGSDERKEGLAAGVYAGTQFQKFGIQLSVRPMVDENDRITLDVNPMVTMPDSQLTREIAQSTGSTLNTTAFNTRSLETTMRTRDGRPLVIAGLISRQISDDQQYTPGVHRLPLLGSLAQSHAKADEDLELVIIVTPTIVREPTDNLALWQFPTPRHLLEAAVGRPHPSELSKSLDPARANMKPTEDDLL